MPTHFPLVVRHLATSHSRRSLLSVAEVARLTGLPANAITRFLDLGLIDPVETHPEPFFTVSVVLRVRRIVRIHRDLDVNWAGIGVVMDLLDKINALEQEVAQLRTELSKAKNRRL
jgi:DNA-binding transcriptional MerR regulator